ncbi:hypothetical protein [Clostridium oceanicum]|uniref:Uncharacterized protein n=1 Tax=Clostridium oceanicum TaxID=1543 RepID=A0ABP3UX28_9CLOT
MNYFLWFNLKKIKTDIDYFLLTLLFLILIQLAFYLPWNPKKLYNLFFGMIFSIFFIYCLTVNKDFKLKDVLKLFFH